MNSVILNDLFLRIRRKFISFRSPLLRILSLACWGALIVAEIYLKCALDDDEEKKIKKVMIIIFVVLLFIYFAEAMWGDKL
ncbi:MAG: hypothetical protein MJ100_00420 [Ruminococcus sp.]|nr:hypothetical protein [Ruminococcus sp.]